MPKKIREQLEEAQGMKDRADRALGMELETIDAEREAERQTQVLQTEREKDIADAYETAGIIKGLQFTEKVVTVTKLVKLDQVKKSKGYKGIGTWKQYCDYCGLDQPTIDERLRQLNVLGEEFLVTVTNFGVGYRDLRRLRQLTHDGAMTIVDDAIVIGEERIPICADHADDIQAAIDTLLSAKEETDKRLEKLEKNLDAAVKEETKGLQAEKKALVKEVKRLKAFDPEDKDRTWAVEQLKAIHDHVAEFSVMVGKVVITDEAAGDEMILGQVEGYIQSAEMLLQGLRQQWEDKVNIFGH